MGLDFVLSDFGQSSGNLREFALIVVRGKISVERVAIDLNDRGDIFGTFHATFNLERRYARFDKPRQQVERVQIFRAEQKFSRVQKIFAVFVDKFIGQATRLRATTAIARPSAD